jgi:hypothetical protein
VTHNPAFARDLERARVLAHDLECTRAFARALGLDLGHASALARALTLDLARDRAFARALDRAQALAVVLDRALECTSDLDLARDIERDLLHARDLALALGKVPLSQSALVRVRGPGWACQVLVWVTALLLPSRYRARYQQEWLAEIWELGNHPRRRRSQLAHAVHLLGQGAPLRRSLTEPVPGRPTGAGSER